MPWTYADIEPLETAPCPQCQTAARVVAEETKDRYRCTSCEIRFTARWQVKPLAPMFIGSKSGSDRIGGFP